MKFWWFLSDFVLLFFAYRTSHNTMNDLKKHLQNHYHRFVPYCLSLKAVAKIILFFICTSVFDFFFKVFFKVSWNSKKPYSLYKLTPLQPSDNSKTKSSMPFFKSECKSRIHTPNFQTFFTVFYLTTQTERKRPQIIIFATLILHDICLILLQ